MKKIVSLLLILILLGSSALASSYSIYTWCEDLPQNATFMFDYRLMSPIRTTQKPSKYMHRVDYRLTYAFVGGFYKDELNPYAVRSSTASVVPVGMEDGVYVYPIVTGANTLVGLVWATVKDCTAKVSMHLRDQVTSYHNDKFALHIYGSDDELVFDGMIYDFDKWFIVENNVFYFEINGVVSYPEIIGSTKIGNCSAYYMLHDYDRNDNTWVRYRNNLMELIRGDYEN